MEKEKEKIGIDDRRESKLKKKMRQKEEEKGEKTCVCTWEEKKAVMLMNDTPGTGMHCKQWIQFLFGFPIIPLEVLCIFILRLTVLGMGARLLAYCC